MALFYGLPSYSAFIQNGAAANHEIHDTIMMICIGPDSIQCNMNKKGGTIVPASESHPIGFAILLIGLMAVFIGGLQNS